MKKSLTEYKEKVMEFFSYLKEGHPVYVFDLETTGLRSSTDTILSFSALKLILNNGILKETDRIDQFINPGYHIPDEITKINGITDEMVADKPDEFDAFDIIKDFLGNNPIIAGYNSERFDQKFMQSFYERNGGEDFEPLFHIDVMKMVKEMLEVKDFKLITAAQELGCDLGLTFHKSMDDVIATSRILQLLMIMYLEENESKEAKKQVKVTGAKYWAPRHDLQRVYVYTYPMTGTYFDVYRKEWSSQLENIDIEALIKDVFQFCNVTNEKELVNKLKGE